MKGAGDHELECWLRSFDYWVVFLLKVESSKMMFPIQIPYPERML